MYSICTCRAVDLVLHVRRYITLKSFHSIICCINPIQTQKIHIHVYACTDCYYLFVAEAPPPTASPPTPKESSTPPPPSPSPPPPPPPTSAAGPIPTAPPPPPPLPSMSSFYLLLISLHQLHNVNSFFIFISIF